MSSSLWLLGVESRDFSCAQKETTAYKTVLKIILPNYKVSTGFPNFQPINIHIKARQHSISMPDAHGLGDSRPVNLHPDI